jgi:hypothetical protein
VNKGIYLKIWNFLGLHIGDEGEKSRVSAHGEKICASLLSQRMVTCISRPKLGLAVAQKLGKIPLGYFQAIDVLLVP